MTHTATASPDSAAGQRGGMGDALLLCGGMITAPVSALRAVLTGGRGDIFAPLLLLVLCGVGIEAKVMARYAYLVGNDPATTLRRAAETVRGALLTHLAVIAGAALVLALWAALLSHKKVAWRAAATAVTYAAVPLVVTMAVGGALSALGTELWWMPHRAVDNLQVLLVDGKVSMARFAVKLVVAYGVPLALLATAVIQTLGAVPAGALGMSRLRAGAAALGVVLVAFGAAAAVDVSNKADRIRPALPGDVLPDVVLKTLTLDPSARPDKVALRSFRGKVLVLDFWASWCNPCRKSMPELSALYTELRGRGVEVLGVNREPTDPQAARKALGQIKPAFPSVIDDRMLGERFGLTTLPTSMVVDQNGVIRHLHMGYTEPSVVRAELLALLNP